MKPKKINEKQLERVWMYQCQRCRNDTDTDGWYCSECAPKQEITFEVFEEDFGDFKGEYVCPWCYNQLVDKFNKELRSN